MNRVPVAPERVGRSVTASPGKSARWRRPGFGDRRPPVFDRAFSASRLLCAFFKKRERKKFQNSNFFQLTFSQIARLKKTLIRWLSQLFEGPYDASYVEQRRRVGLKHVQIGLAQVYTEVDSRHLLEQYRKAHPRA